MKVDQIIAGLDNPAAGTSYTVLSLAEALSRQGVCGRVHTLRPVPENLSPQTEIVGYPASALIRRLGISPAMRRGLAGTDADILHNHGVWMMPNIYAGRTARERSIPLIFAPRGMLSAWSLAFSRGRKRFLWQVLGQRRAIAAAHCFHATSEDEAEDIRRLGFRQPIAVVPNGVHIPGPAPPAPSPGRRTVLFLGRIHPKKGIPVLLRAWQAVEPGFPDWDLVIAGPDEAGHLAEVRGLAETLDLKRVSFPGPAYGPAKDALLRAASLFVLPTHSENFGIAIAEALAYGLPVITTTGAPWQELESRGIGWWIELSARPLSQTLRAALDLPDARRRQMGRSGRRWMEESFGWESVARRMKEVYAWMLGGASAPSCVRFA